MKRPVSMYSAATDDADHARQEVADPDVAGRQADADEGGVHARFGVAIRTSEASARAKPPPAAAPFTQAMIGCGQRRMAMTISLISPLAGQAGADRAVGACGSPRSFRSRPAQKALPAPCSTTTRTSRRQ